jgi:hypothetical protein
MVTAQPLGQCRVAYLDFIAPSLMLKTKDKKPQEKTKGLQTDK